MRQCQHQTISTTSVAKTTAARSTKNGKCLKDHESICDSNLATKITANPASVDLDAFTACLEEPTPSTWFEKVEEFSTVSERDFVFGHLNINSIYTKFSYINDILNLRKYDLFFVQETRIDASVPDAFVHNQYYNMIRRDRGTDTGGGLIVYVAKSLAIVSQSKSTNCELLALTLNVNNCNYNFVYGYNPSFANQKFFCLFYRIFY